MNSKQQAYQTAQTALLAARTLKAEAMIEYEWMLDCDPESPEFDEYTVVDMEMDERYNINTLMDAVKVTEDALVDWALRKAAQITPLDMEAEMSKALDVLSKTRSVTARRRIVEAAMKL